MTRYVAVLAMLLSGCTSVEDRSSSGFESGAVGGWVANNASCHVRNQTISLNAAGDLEIRWPTEVTLKDGEEEVEFYYGTARDPSGTVTFKPVGSRGGMIMNLHLEPAGIVESNEILRRDSTATFVANFVAMDVLEGDANAYTAAHVNLFNQKLRCELEPPPSLTVDMVKDLLKKGKG